MKAIISLVQTHLAHRMLVQDIENFTMTDIANGPTVPNKIFNKMLDYKSFAGHMTENPFEFKHFNIKELELKWNHKTYPANPTI